MTRSHTSAYIANRDVRKRTYLAGPPPVDTSREAYRAACEQLVEVFYQDLPNEIVAQEITPIVDRIRKIVQADGGQS